MKDLSKWLLERERIFGRHIHEFPALAHYYLPWLAIDRHTAVIAWRLYREQPHWHTYRGKCDKRLPFELLMQALGLLICCWVADIFQRKEETGKPRK